MNSEPDSFGPDDAYSQPEFNPSWEFLHSGDETSRSLERFFEEYASLTTSDRLDCLLMDQCLRWQSQFGPSVGDYLSRFPEFAVHPTFVLDLVYGEVRHRRRLRLPVDLEALCAQYPAIAGELIEQMLITEEVVPQDSADERANLISDSLQAGQTFGAFQLIKRLGGSVSQVFHAKCPAKNLDYAVKVFLEDTRESAQQFRFQNELDALMTLDHPVVLPILGHGEDHGLKWICQPVIPEGDLTQHFERIQHDVPAIVQIMTELCEGVEAIHQRGFAHLDLKPANVLLDSHHRPRLIDFEFARRLGGRARTPEVLEAAGTLAWMAPEVFRAPGKGSDILCDIFGLGAILYFLLTGEPPNSGTSALEVIRNLKKGHTRTLKEPSPFVSEPLQAICRKAIDHRPEDRYQTAGAMAIDLRSLPVVAPRDDEADRGAHEGGASSDFSVL